VISTDTVWVLDECTENMIRPSKAARNPSRDQSWF
jgi:hypothetical protein